MSPYQRAAAATVARHPSTAPVVTGRTPWPGRGDRAGQGLLAFAVAVVLAAMACNWLDVFLDLFGHDPGVVDAAMRTWALDAGTVMALGTAGVVHSAVRRGRPGRWPVTVLCTAATASVVLVPALVG